MTQAAISMRDRREPQVAAVMRRLQGHHHEHVLDRIAERLAAALAGTREAETVVLAFDELNGAKVTIHGVTGSA